MKNNNNNNNKNIRSNLSLGMYGNLSKIIVTLKLKTHLSFMRTHAMILFNKKSMVIFYNQCYYDETNNAPSLATSDTIDNEEWSLDMLYDNALDDGPMILDNHPCLKNEDINDELTAHDDALISKS